MKLIELFISPGLSLLPEPMRTREAKAMLLAIGLQESRFQHRRQINGPAHGFWQFEKGGGIKGVLNHKITKKHINDVCETLLIPNDPDDCYEAVVYNDILACCFARLLLWTLPYKLPGENEGDLGWEEYLDAWRPGKPHHETWGKNFSRAWEMVE